MEQKTPMWKTQPVYYDAMVIGNSIYAVKDGLGTNTKIGVIILSQFSFNAQTKRKMRHIRVNGTNGTAYHAKFCETKGNIVTLKRTIDKCHRIKRANANRGRKGGQKTQSLARIKKFNFGERCK